MWCGYQIVRHPHELNLPLTPLVEPAGRLEQVAEAHVLLDAVLFGHISEIRADFLSRSKELGPVGVVGETVLKDVRRDVCCRK